MEFTSKCHYRVLYGDTDQMGIVYHVNYLKYMEIGRVEYLRDRGWVYREMEESGVRIPLINLNINYKSPAKYDDLVRIETKVIKLTAVRISFEYQLFVEGEERLLTTGETHHVFAGTDNRPKRVGSEILDVIQGEG